MMTAHTLKPAVAAAISAHRQPRRCTVENQERTDWPLVLHTIDSSATRTIQSKSQNCNRANLEFRQIPPTNPLINHPRPTRPLESSRSRTPCHSQPSLAGGGIAATCNRTWRGRWKTPLRFGYIMGGSSGCGFGGKCCGCDGCW